MEIRRFRYRPKLRTFIWVTIFFAAATAMIAHEIPKNTQVSLFYHSLILSPELSKVFMYLLLLIGVAFTGIGIYGIYLYFNSPLSYLVFYDDRVEIPGRFFKGKALITYAEIQDIKEWKYKGTQMIVIHLKSGKSGFSDPMFEKDEQYQNAKETLFQLWAPYRQNKR